MWLRAVTLLPHHFSSPFFGVFLVLCFFDFGTHFLCQNVLEVPQTAPGLRGFLGAVTGL